jgi:hypothetical protein
MSRFLAFPISILLLSFAAAVQTADGGHHPQPVPVEFTEGIAHYMDIHRAVVAMMGPPLQHTDPKALLDQQWAFADAIRARRCEEMGAVFTPSTAAFFRARIATILHETEVDVAGILREMDEDWEEEAPLPETNDPFPWGAGNMMWPSMLLRLPELPRELEYRFVGRDLVILDVRASLVVDVLVDALPDACQDVSEHAADQPCDADAEPIADVS